MEKWEQKLHDRAHKWARILGRLPGVAAIFLSGSLAQGRAKKTSDIDILVIAHPGQIWTARCGVFLLLRVCGRLAKPHHHAGQLCPNHFLTADALEIREKDAYSANLFAHNIPLHDPWNVFADFYERNHLWVQDLGACFPCKPPGKCHYRVPKMNRMTKKRESILKHWQIRKIQRNPDGTRPGACIILEDTELRFHPCPKNKLWGKSPK